MKTFEDNVFKTTIESTIDHIVITQVNKLFDTTQIISIYYKELEHIKNLNVADLLIPKSI